MAGPKTSYRKATSSMASGKLSRPAPVAMPARKSRVPNTMGSVGKQGQSNRYKGFSTVGKIMGDAARGARSVRLESVMGKHGSFRRGGK